MPNEPKNAFASKFEKCSFCGTKRVQGAADLEHIVPRSIGRQSALENLIVVCAKCNSRQPREYEFLNFLAEILEKDSEFSAVQREPVLGSKMRFRADLVAKRTFDSRIESVLIECKTSIVSYPGQISNIVALLKKYQSASIKSVMVLATPVTIRPTDKEILNEAKIEIWDLDFIRERFAKQIELASPSYYKSLFLSLIAQSAKIASREWKLMQSVSACKPGKAECYIYQTLVGEILECLFTPALLKPLSEISDKSKANRRDFIMPNYAENGFWAFMRTRYKADYIVVDAKNYVGKIKKPQVVQIANYLKPQGAGLFGLIFSRNGGDAVGCEHTLREQWTDYGKMILIFDDDDIRAMLTAKLDGRDPEDILSEKIQRFRLSM